MLGATFDDLEVDWRIEDFHRTIRHRLREHTLGFDVVEGFPVEKDAQELHPGGGGSTAHTRMHGRTRFAEAERQQNRDALHELNRGNWAGG